MKRGLHIIGLIIFYPALLLGRPVVKSEKELSREYGLTPLVTTGLPKVQTVVFYGRDGVPRACYRCKHKSKRRYCNQVVPIHDIDRHIQQLHSEELKK